MIIYLEVWQFVVWVSLPILLLAVGWLWTNRKVLSDKINLRFRRARVVQVRLHTASGAVIDRFVVPNANRFVKLNSGKTIGWYYLEPDFSERNQRYNVPCYDIVETQIQPALPKIGIAKGKLSKEDSATSKAKRLVSKFLPLEVETKEADGGIKRETRQVETVHLHFRSTFPQKLQLLHGGAAIAAHEVQNLMTSYIVERMALAQAEMVKQARLTFIIVCCILGAVVLSGILDYTTLKDISTKLNTLVGVALRSNIGGSP